MTFFPVRIVEYTSRVLSLLDPVQYRLVRIGEVQVMGSGQKLKDGGMQIFLTATISATLFTCKAGSSFKRRDMTV
jgi:hypothetical protein